MQRVDLDAVQRRAPAQNGPWKTDANEMRKKTVVRRILKMYCDDPGFIRAVEVDDATGGIDAEPEGPPVGRHRLNGRTEPPPVENYQSDPAPPEPSEEDARREADLRDWTEAIGQQQDAAGCKRLREEIEGKAGDDGLGQDVAAELLRRLDTHEKVLEPAKGRERS